MNYIDIEEELEFSFRTVEFNYDHDWTYCSMHNTRPENPMMKNIMGDHGMDCCPDGLNWVENINEHRISKKRPLQVNNSPLRKGIREKSLNSIHGRSQEEMIMSECDGIPNCSREWFSTSLCNSDTNLLACTRRSAVGEACIAEETFLFRS